MRRRDVEIDAADGVHGAIRLLEAAGQITGGGMVSAGLPCCKNPSLAARGANSYPAGWFSQLSPGGRRLTTSAGPCRLEITEMGLSSIAAQHDIQHRGRVHAMRAGTAAPPPAARRVFSSIRMRLCAPQDLRASGVHRGAERGLAAGDCFSLM